jgi:hypothetical protein
LEDFGPHAPRFVVFTPLPPKLIEGIPWPNGYESLVCDCCRGWYGDDCVEVTAAEVE